MRGVRPERSGGVFEQTTTVSWSLSRTRSGASHLPQGRHLYLMKTMSKISAILFALIMFQLSSVSLCDAKPNLPIKVDTTKKQTNNTTQNTTARQKTDTTKINQLSIDTNKTSAPPQQTIPPPIDTVKKVDSVLTAPVSENTLTNTKLFIYTLLSAGGLGFFFFIFVLTLFKTFHKKRSTRQSLLLAWNLFFVVSIIWLFIIWGLVAGFWTSSAFMVVMIFLFLISLIMTIIAIKSK